MSSIETKHGILVGVDGSAQSDAAVRWATQEAKMRALPVTLIHAIVPVVATWPMGPMQASVTEWQEENARNVIEQSRKTLDAAAGDEKLNVRTEIAHSPAAPLIIDASKEAWMVVVGSRGVTAFGRTLLGSVCSSVLHHAHCPVAVIHDDAARPDPQAPVVLGIDGSPASEAATALAFDEASRRGVDLVAIHAWSDIGVFPILGMDWRKREDQGQEVLSERLAGWQERYPDVQVHRRLVCDQPARWLIEESLNAQLVVVGSHGRGGFAGMLLGSVSSVVAQTTAIPVIVVRGP